ncbi:hypothetical protein, partial [Maribacter flavus]|uniref:hypothetical protein n=1 Tax=Maribacter flavus TaxID=1658664 RepID=UPI003D339782
AQLEYEHDDNHSFLLSGKFTSNRRGRTSAITEEVFSLMGNKCNPYWGLQDGKIRNSRERFISEAMVLFNYFYNADKLDLS